MKGPPPPFIEYYNTASINEEGGGKGGQSQYEKIKSVGYGTGAKDR